MAGVRIKDAGDLRTFTVELSRWSKDLLFVSSRGQWLDIDITIALSNQWPSCSGFNKAMAIGCYRDN